MLSISLSVSQFILLNFLKFYESWFFSFNIFVGPGTDVAGEVAEVGPGVKDFKVGDKVIAKIGHEVIFFSAFHDRVHVK